MGHVDLGHCPRPEGEQIRRGALRRDMQGSQSHCLWPWCLWGDAEGVDVLGASSARWVWGADDRGDGHEEEKEEREDVPILDECDAMTDTVRDLASS